jgi:hypothetical protein
MKKNMNGMVSSRSASNEENGIRFLADASSYKSISAQRNLYLTTKSRFAAMLNIESS